MANTSNAGAKIAPGESEGVGPIDEPYTGAPGNYGHVGYSLNAMFAAGLDDGVPDQWR